MNMALGIISIRIETQGKAEDTEQPEEVPQGQGTEAAGHGEAPGS